MMKKLFLKSSFGALLMAGVMIISSCEKESNNPLTTYENTFIITNSSDEAPNGSEATFSIWANGNVGGELVKDGEYYIPLGQSITITTSVDLPADMEIFYSLTSEGPDGCWQNCDYKAAITNYPSSNPSITSGDKIKWNMNSSQVTVQSTGGGNGSGVSGNWVRSDGASYLKFSGNTVYLCNGSSGQEFSGTYDADAGTATLVEGSTTLTFYISPEGDDKILIEQYVSGNHVGSQYYYSTSEYPCN